VIRPLLLGLGLCAGLLTAAAASAGSDIDQFKQKLSSQMKEFTIDDVKPSPIAGLYEVTVNGETVLISADGKYLLTGDMIEVATRINLSEKKRGKKILSAIEQGGEKNMIVMGPAKPKHTITVFTDVDCPYCSKFHNEVPALNQAGVKVRYLLYPRAGPGSDTFKRSVAVWCAKDRVKAVGIAKAGGAVDMKTCDNPVTANYKLGQSLGINGTPTIILDSGQIIPGYVPAEKLVAGLEQAAVRN
jgi:thiol:disulfide interchange protein DsbC